MATSERHTLSDRSVSACHCAIFRDKEHLRILSGRLATPGKRLQRRSMRILYDCDWLGRPCGSGLRFFHRFQFDFLSLAVWFPLYGGWGSYFKRCRQKRALKKIFTKIKKFFKKLLTLVFFCCNVPLGIEKHILKRGLKK